MRRRTSAAVMLSAREHPARLAGSSTVWQQEAPSAIGNVVVDRVRVRPQDGLVLVGTHGKGVYSMDSALPVELAAFEAVADGEAVALSWQTLAETNNSGFEVQMRRAAEEAWETLAFVAGAGTTTETRRYTYRTDRIGPGTFAFRLRQVDFDGTYAYSPVVEQAVELATDYRLGEVWPHPVRSAANLSVSVREAQDVRVELFNTLGQRAGVLHDGRLSGDREHTLALELGSYAPGTYVVRVEGATFAETRRVTVVR